MSQLVTTLNTVVTHIPWAAIGATGIISPLLVVIKKWFTVQSEKVMIILVLVISLLTATGHYLLHVPAHDPSIIAIQTATLAFMTQPFYFFVVKPTVQWVEGQITKAAAYDLQVKDAAEPATGVPLATSATATTTIQDFSH